jgi:hypothetical protein
VLAQALRGFAITRSDESEIRKWGIPSAPDVYEDPKMAWFRTVERSPGNRGESLSRQLDALRQIVAGHRALVEAFPTGSFGPRSTWRITEWKTHLKGLEVDIDSAQTALLDGGDDARAVQALDAALEETSELGRLLTGPAVPHRRLAHWLPTLHQC